MENGFSCKTEIVRDFRYRWEALISREETLTGMIGEQRVENTYHAILTIAQYMKYSHIPETRALILIRFRETFLLLRLNNP